MKTWISFYWIQNTRPPEAHQYWVAIRLHVDISGHVTHSIKVQLYIRTKRGKLFLDILCWPQKGSVSSRYIKYPVGAPLLLLQVKISKNSQLLVLMCHTQ